MSSSAGSGTGLFKIGKKGSTDDNGLYIREDYGNVGIKKYPTGYALDVNGAINTNKLYINDSKIIMWDNDGSNVSFNTGNVGIGSTNPTVSLDISAVDAIQIPVGNTTDRPTDPAQGMVRYNTSDNQFEGYSGTTWQGLGGVISTDQYTKITADNSGDLIFYTKDASGVESVERLKIDSSGNFIWTSSGNIGIGSTNPTVSLDISATDAIRIPVGNESERPTDPTQGMVRYNTTDSQFEGYSGTTWQGLGGVISTDQNTKITADNNGDLIFYTKDGDNDATTERLKIDDQGDLYLPTSFVSSDYNNSSDSAGYFLTVDASGRIQRTSTSIGASSWNSGGTSDGSGNDTETFLDNVFILSSTLEALDVSTSTIIDINKGAGVFAGGISSANDLELVESLIFTDSSNGQNEYITDHSIQSESSFGIVFDTNLQAITTGVEIPTEFSVSRTKDTNETEKCFTIYSAGQNDARIGIGQGVSGNELTKEVEIKGDTLFQNNVDICGTLAIDTISDVKTYIEDISTNLSTLSQNQIANTDDSTDTFGMDSDGALSHKVSNVEVFSVSKKGDISAATVTISGTLGIGTISDVQTYIEEMSSNLITLSQNQYANTNASGDTFIIDDDGALIHTVDSTEVFTVSQTGDISATSVTVSGTLTIDTISDVKEYIEEISSNLSSLTINELVNSNDSSDTFSIDTDGSISHKINNIEIMTINTSGVMYLSSTLDVNVLSIDSISAQQSYITFNSDIATSYSVAIGSPQMNSDYNFYVLGNGYIDEELTIGGDTYVSGDVGIGTTSPTCALDVSGSANIEGNLTFGTINMTTPIQINTTYDLHDVKYILVSSNSSTFIINGFQLFDSESNILYDSNYTLYTTSTSTDYLTNKLLATSTTTDSVSIDSSNTSYPNVLVELNAAVKFNSLTSISTESILDNNIQLGSDINGDESTDQFGNSVSLSSDGTILAVGANKSDIYGKESGYVRVYQYLNNVWSQLGSDIEGEASGDKSGWSVSLSSDGTILAIGAVAHDNNGTNSGQVRVFQYSNDSWSQLGSDIYGTNDYDNLGNSVHLSSDGTILAIGVYRSDDTGTDSGGVRVYQYSNNAWSQLGSDIEGEASGDYFGYSVSLSSDGTILAIGAPQNDDSGTNSGHVRVYQYSNDTWSQLGSDIDGEVDEDRFGQSVSLSSDGTIVAIGAPRNDDYGTDSGYVRVYQYSNNAWSQLGSDIGGEASGDYFGYSVSLSSDGTILAIGAVFNDASGSDSGHVRVYQYSNDTWSQVGSDIDGEAIDDQFGTSISLSSDGTIVAIGAPYNDDYGSSSGHVRVYQLSIFNYQIDFVSKTEEIIRSVSTIANETLYLEDDSLNYIGIGVDIENATLTHAIEFVGDTGFQNNVNISESATISGNLTVSGDTISSSYSNSSDDRLKHNEYTIQNSLDTIRKLKPMTYFKTSNLYDASHNFTLNASNNPIDESGNIVNHSVESGFIAQEVEKIPALKHCVMAGDDTSPYSLKYNDIFVHNVAAVQEIDRTVESLRIKNTKLEALLLSMLQRIESLEKTSS
jgi:uncharacterized membrane protein